MLEVLRDEQGNITAVCEYLLFDDENQLNDNGRHLVVCHVEVNPIHRNNGCINSLIRLLLPKQPQAEMCHFIRGFKYKDRAPRTYTRKQFERYIGGL